MDYSSYTQTPQQDPNQYHQQQQGQEQQQQYHQQPYDSSQFQYQAYDHLSQSYYSHYPPQYDQHYYYQSSQDYSSSYSQQPQPQFHQESTSIHPPGVPIPLDLASSAQTDQTHLQNQPNSHYSHGIAENQRQSDPPGSISVSSSALNPAAVAALSQLAQFAGNAQMPIHPPVWGFICYIFLVFINIICFIFIYRDIIIIILMHRG